MNLLTQPKELRATFAVWQLMRSLGFRSSVLFVGVSEGRLLVQVEKICTIKVGTTAMTQDEFSSVWLSLSENIEGIPESDMKANYLAHITPEMCAAVLVSLKAHGIPLPAEMN